MNLHEEMTFLNPLPFVIPAKAEMTTFKPVVGVVTNNNY